MECAMVIATHKGGPRCPQCREPFHTITQKGGRYEVNLTSNILYRFGEPYLHMSAQQIKIASRIFVGEQPDESGTMSMQFYVPQFLQEVHEFAEWSLVVTDADDGPIGRVMRRSDTTAFSYDQARYRNEVQNTVGKLHELMGTHDPPLFFMKAQVSKAFMEMVEIGKFHMKSYPSHPLDNTDGGEKILSMVFPASYLAYFATMGNIDPV